MSLARDIGKAFRNRWHLLTLCAAIAFAWLSGAGSVLIPLVLAGDVAFLGFVGTNPKYQALLTGREVRETELLEAQQAQEHHRELMIALPPHLRARFEQLKSRCMEIRRIALTLRRPNPVQETDVLEEMRLEGLDKLLWMYLRLLYSHHSISKFLEKTSVTDIQKDIDRLQARLSDLPTAPENAQTKRMRETIEDNLDTCRNRLTNFQRAVSSSDLMALEIDRLENKIQTLTEMAINRQEPDYIADQIDLVAGSLFETEQAMNELDFATGFSEVEEAVPHLLREQAVEEAG